MSPKPSPVVAPSKLAQRLEEIEKASANDSPHVIVKALAGTGKTTTLVEGLKVVKGLPTSITPSPQQKAVWDAMALSKGANSVCFVAFNKAIADELKNRVPAGCDAMTMHSMGLKAINRAFKVRIENFRVSNIISDILGDDIRNIRRQNPILVKATEELVNLCKMNLVVCDLPEPKTDEDAEALMEFWTKELGKLAAYYDVDCNHSQRAIFELVPQVLDRCKRVDEDYSIDFADMIWLPVVLNLPVYQYDVLLVDESQDLNRCQQALAKRAGKRLILCGDPQQAIYGFAGADDKSMTRMADELAETPRGCVTLPLTVTRRCGKAIVEQAKTIVPEFEAHESNGGGKITEALYTHDRNYKPRPVEKTYIPLVKDGDMLICRVNAPLVSQCFRFLRMGRKAVILGRDIGQGLISTVRKQKTNDIPELVGKLDDWLHKELAKEQAKRNPSEARLIALQDRYDCLVCFTEGMADVEQMIAKIEAVFTDNRDQPGIRLSSIHKSKGLEAKRVFLLEPNGGTVPHPMAKSDWQRKQEMNLRYVAITRAIEELIYVTAE